MANPTVAHAHDMDQVLALVDDVVPKHIMDRIRPVLVDRDRSVEDGVNQGLRKTKSAATFGNGGTVNSIYPAWSVWHNDIVVPFEKQHDPSRFEIDVTLSGQIGLVDSTVVVGARHQLADGTAAAADSFVGQFQAGAGDFYTYTVHQKIAEQAPKGLYNVTVLCAVAAAGQSFKELATCVSSLRVVESVW